MPTYVGEEKKHLLKIKTRAGKEALSRSVIEWREQTRNLLGS